MALTSGTRIGPYEILSQLGAGGTGEGYLTEDTRLERKVALKRPAAPAGTPRSAREDVAILWLYNPDRKQARPILGAGPSGPTTASRFNVQ